MNTKIEQISEFTEKLVIDLKNQSCQSGKIWSESAKPVFMRCGNWELKKGLNVYVGGLM